MGITITKERFHELTHAAATLEMIKDSLTSKHADGSPKTWQEMVEEVRFFVRLHDERED